MNVGTIYMAYTPFCLFASTPVLSHAKSCLDVSKKQYKVHTGDKVIRNDVDKKYRWEDGILGDTTSTYAAK